MIISVQSKNFKSKSAYKKDRALFYRGPGISFFSSHRCWHFVRGRSEVCNYICVFAVSLLYLCTAHTPAHDNAHIDRPPLSGVKCMCRTFHVMSSGSECLSFCLPLSQGSQPSKKPAPRISTTLCLNPSPPPCQAPILSWRLLLIKNGRKKGGKGLGLAVTEAQVERVVWVF